MRSDNSGSSTARAKVSAPTIVATMASASSSDLRRRGIRLAIRFMTVRTAPVKLCRIAAPFPMARGQIPDDVFVQSRGVVQACRTGTCGVIEGLGCQTFLGTELAVQAAVGQSSSVGKGIDANAR